MFNASATIYLDGKKQIWNTKRLWRLAENLQEFECLISSIINLNRTIRFPNHDRLTLNDLIHHMKRINNAEMNYPVILDENGLLMDGFHRICKSLLEGKHKISAVQFIKNPDPDAVIYKSRDFSSTFEMNTD